MKITELRLERIPVNHRGDWLFVELHTDSGIVGLGEASQSGDDAMVALALEQVGRFLQGEDPTCVDVLWERLNQRESLFCGGTGRIGRTAVSAVDQALWDICGKAHGVSVSRLLGGAHRDEIRLYANVNRGCEDRSPDGFARAAARAVTAGFGAVKCAPFDEITEAGRDRDGLRRDLDHCVERVASTRREIGSGIELMVDCHCRFDLPLALEVAQRLQEFDLAWLEEPVPRDQTDAMLKVAAQSGVTLAGGEGFFSRGDCWDWIRRGAVQVIMPDAKHAGGITECRRIAQLAEVAHVGFSPHNPAGPVSTMAAVHLSASVANFWVLEFAFGEVDWRESLTVPNEWVANGCIQVPDRPGLGIELNRSLLNSLSARPLGG